MSAGPVTRAFLDGLTSTRPALPAQRPDTPEDRAMLRDGMAMAIHRHHTEAQAARRAGRMADYAAAMALVERATRLFQAYGGQS